MSENTPEGTSLEERIKKLEYLQRNTRIAIIILVGYSIYDVISVDSGSEIVFAQKVKAREFELIDGAGTIFGSWKVLDEKKKTAGIVIENTSGNQVRIMADQISLMQGRINPSPKATLGQNGVQIHEHSQVIDQEVE